MPASSRASEAPTTGGRNESGYDDLVGRGHMLCYLPTPDTAAIPRVSVATWQKFAPLPAHDAAKKKQARP